MDSSSEDETPESGQPRMQNSSSTSEDSEEESKVKNVQGE